MRAVVFEAFHGTLLFSCNWNKLAGPLNLSTWQRFKNSSVYEWLKNIKKNIIWLWQCFRAPSGFAWVWNEVYLIFRFFAVISNISGNKENLRGLAKYFMNMTSIFWRIIMQLSRSGSTKKVWYFKGLKTFLQIKLQVHFEANYKEIIDLIQQKCFTERQHIEHFSTSNHSLILLLYKYHSREILAPS